MKPSVIEGLLRPIQSLMKIYSTATLPVYSLLQKPEKVQALRKSLRVLPVDGLFP